MHKHMEEGSLRALMTLRGKTLRHWQRAVVGLTLSFGAWIFGALPAAAQVTTSNVDIALGDRDPLSIISMIINIALGFLAFLAVAIILYGGYLWMTSGGNEEKIMQAKKLLRNAAIGLLIILSAWGLTLWLIGAISDATDDSTTGGSGGCEGCGPPNITATSEFRVMSVVPRDGQTNVPLCYAVAITVGGMHDAVDPATGNRTKKPQYIDPDSLVDPDTGASTGVFELKVKTGAQDGAVGANEGAFCSTNKECASALCTNNACVGNSVAGRIALGSDEDANTDGLQTTVFSFIPDADYEIDTEYEVRVKGGTAGLRSDTGSTLQSSLYGDDFVSSFTTGSTTDTVPPQVTLNRNSPFPGDGDVDICLNAPISFDFNEPILPTSVGDASFLLDKADNGSVDWQNTTKLHKWTTGFEGMYAQARPAQALEVFTEYGVRLNGGDPDNNFEGAITDMCGNPLDGNRNGVAEGGLTDSFSPPDGDSATIPNEDGSSTTINVTDPLTWTTGENAQCFPEITKITPTADYYGEYSGAMHGEACTENADCASNSCSAAGFCEGNGNTSTLLTIEGRYLGPNPSVLFLGDRTEYAAEGIYSCFDQQHFGNLPSDTSVGDQCIDAALQENSKIRVRVPVGTTPSQLMVDVAKELSEPSADTLGILSPKISAVDPLSGAPGQFITLYGSNFESGDDQIGRVMMRTVDGRTSELNFPDAALCGDTWSDTQVVAVVPETYTNADGSTGRWEEGEQALIQLIRADDRHSDLREFVFTSEVRPSICRIAPDAADAGGEAFTVYGKDLGSSQSGKNVVFEGSVSDQSVFNASINEWRDTEVLGTTSPAMGQDQYWVTVQDGDMESNGLHYRIPAQEAPAVVEINQCNEADNIYPTPNPRPNATNACLNAAIGILFNQTMNRDTLTVGNIIVEQKNRGGAFNADFPGIQMSADLNSAFSGTVDTSDWKVTVGDNEYHGLQIDVRHSPIDENQDGQADDSSAHLQPDTWYQVTVTTNVQNPGGVGLTKPYVYRFKTENSQELCSVSSVQVTPSRALLNSFKNAEGDIRSAEYEGSAYAAQCRLIDRDDVPWSWASSNTNVGDFNNAPTNFPKTRVYAQGDTEENVGRSTITATVTNSGDNSKISDDALFELDFAFCTKDTDCNQCGDGVSRCNLEENRCEPVIMGRTTNDGATQIPAFDPKDGAPGTYVTINGCYLGTNGTVNMNKDGISIETQRPNPQQCGNTWSNDSIIIEVPKEYDADSDGTRETEIPLGDYTFEVKPRDTQMTATSSEVFTVNNQVRPNLCRIVPDWAMQFQRVTAYGSRLGDEEGSATFLSNDDYDEDGVVDRIAADPEETTWADQEIRTAVAQGATSPSGDDGFRAVLPGGDIQCKNNDPLCSNSVQFYAGCRTDDDCGSGYCGEDGVCKEPEIACTTDDDCGACGEGASQCVNNTCTPYIQSITPGNAETGNGIANYGAAVNINGCYFGSYSTNSAVLFNETSATLECSDPWSDTLITARVPNQDQISAESQVTVRRRDGVVSNTKSFLASQQCAAEQTPVLCGISPSSGFTSKPDTQSGTRITFKGLNFVEDSVASVFPRGIDGLATTYTNSRSFTAVIPSGTTSGLVHVENRPDDVSANSCVSGGRDIAISCSSAADCAEGDYCANGQCVTPDACVSCTAGNAGQICGASAGCSATGCCAQRPHVIAQSVQNNATDVCVNSLFSITFSEEMMNGFMKMQEKVGDDDYQDVPGTKSLDEENAHTTHWVPSDTISVLKTDTEYRILIPSSDGSPNSALSKTTSLALEGGDVIINFRTSKTICKPDEVQLQYESTGDDVASLLFTAANQQETIKAKVLSNGQEIVATPDLDWDYVWSPYYDENRCNNVAWVDGDQSQSAMASSQRIVSGNQNHGSDTLQAELNAKKGWVNPASGRVSDSANMRTFFCTPEHLWQYVDDPSFEASLTQQKSFVERGTPAYPQYFDMVYCNAPNDATPTLRAPLVSRGNPNDTGGWFLQYLFISEEKAQEAMAIRVYPNTENLAIQDWYDQNVPRPGNPSAVKVNGYEALKDGRTYYVAASNVSHEEEVDEKHKLYNNVYLITFNDNAGPELERAVMQYFTFNSNVDAGSQQCNASDKDKLIRDTKRVNDLGSIAHLANEHYQEHRRYPDTQSQSFGSYISNVTTSVWNSWQGALGNNLGRSLPTDPYNFFYAASSFTPYAAGETPWVREGTEPNDCEYLPDQGRYYDANGTCWDPVNQTFFCPKNSSVYLYRKNSDRQASLYAHLEYDAQGSQTYKDKSSVQVTDNVCSGTGNNNNCSCFNYGIGSQSSPAQNWQPITSN